MKFSFRLVGGAPGFDVFTTRPDTLYGASFAAISPDHPLAERLARDSPELAAFIAECRRQGTSAEQLETADKLGFDTGLAVAHPLDPDWHLPVWVVNYVLLDYGTGAIFGCRSEEHTSELQSLMRISYAVFCLKKKNKKHTTHSINA